MVWKKDEPNTANTIPPIPVPQPQMNPNTPPQYFSAWWMPSQEIIDNNTRNMTQRPSAPVNYQWQRAPDPQQLVADKELEKNLWTIKIETVSPEHKKRKINWFFRILTTLTILTVWVLLLLTQLWVVWDISYNWIVFNIAFPYILIFWAFILFTYKRFVSKIIWFLLFLVVVWWVTTIVTYHSLVTQPSNIPQSTYQVDANTGNKLTFDTLIWSYDIKWKNIANQIEMKYYWDRNLIATAWTDTIAPSLLLKEDANWNILQKYSSNIEADLPSSNKFDLTINNMAGYKDLNLTDINWTKLSLNWWRGDTIVKVWKNINPESEINVDLLVWRAIFKFPETVWIDLYYKGLYTSMEMIDMEPKDNWHYQSKNYATATQKIKVTVHLGLGTLKVDWIK